jgi:hypothetical protein
MSNRVVITQYSYVAHLGKSPIVVSEVPSVRHDTGGARRFYSPCLGGKLREHNETAVAFIWTHTCGVGLETRKIG